MTSALLWLGIAAGAASAAAALYGRYYELPGFLTGPKICQEEASGCQILFRSKRAAFLGVPNSLLALLFYPWLAAGLHFGWPVWLLLAGASSALAMSIRLGYSLLSRKLQCRICWTGHLANAAIWIALLFRIFS
jgi:uncharacterized membrane protein